ncbi:MAG: hypothetical protein ABI592_16960 [Acidobacteriota bacterium]
MLRRAVLFALFAAALAPASRARAERLWTLQLAGGSVVLSLDAPEERGAAFVFHRHPDGVFSSVRTADVRRISIAEGPDRDKKRARAWEVLVIGRDAEGPDRGTGERGAPRGPASAPASPEGDIGYGFSTWGYPGTPGFPYHRPPGVPPPGRVPSLARPNGFPAVGPLGPAAPPIGPNGFPILAPAVPTPVFRTL